VLLVEPLLRRATFLEEACASWSCAARWCAAPAPRSSAARCSWTPSPRARSRRSTARGWSLPLLRPGGRLLALKGERADSELASSGAALKAAGAASASVAVVGDEAQATLGRVVVVVRDASPLPSARKKARR
jgi:16S rRNA (guanine527-N7)-methyltransferase